ncbi:hypothetical protein [Fluviicola sp.]|uniref:hypothetical protein n=1 Tax=Fluviicola sp. TaxID=1917219 RepID=UPI0031DC4C2A
MTEDDNINKLFRDVFENLEVTPPVSVKMGVDKELGPKVKFRSIFWWLPVLVLLLTGVAFAVVHYGSAAKQPVSTTLQANSTSSDDEASPESNASEKLNNSSGTEIDSANLEQELTENRLAKNSGKVQPDANHRSLNGGRKQQHVQLKKGRMQHENSKEIFKHSGLNEKRNTAIGKSGAVSTQKTPVTKPKIRAKSSFRKTKKNPKETGGKLATAATGDGKTVSGTLGDATSSDRGKTDPAAGGSEKAGPATSSSPKDKELKEKEKVDSVQKADSLATITPADSLPEPDKPKEKPSKDDSKAKNWMVELHGGPRFGRKTSKSDFALKEATSYQIGLGFSRRLNLGPLNYVTLDGEYGAGKESYRSESTTTTVNLIGIDSVPILDSTQTDTIGYTYTNSYDTINSTIENNVTSVITRFAFGLRTEFNFNLGAGFGLAVIPGYYYSMSKFKFSDGTTGSSRNSQLLLGLGVYYDWNRFRFRVGLDSRYELMSKNQNAFIDKRKSMLFSPQFGIAVKF